MPERPYTADPVLATPIGDLREWQLHIQCGRCWRHVVLSLGDLAARLGGQTRITDIIRRLRCAGFRGPERCRGAPKRVILVRVATYGKTTQRLREIVVVNRTRRGGDPGRRGEK